MKTLDFCLTHSPQSISKFRAASNRIGRLGPAGRLRQARCAACGIQVTDNNE